MSKKNKEKQLLPKFNERMQDLFLEMRNIQKEYKLKRVNCIILLKALLEEKNSMLYDFLCATSTAGQNPYKDIIKDCEKELKKLKGKEEEIKEGEKPFTIMFPNEEDSISIYMTNNLWNVLYDTISNLSEDLKEEGQDEEELIVDSEDILINFIADTPKDVLYILKNNGVYIEAFLQYYDLLAEMYDTDVAEGSVEDSDSEKIPKTISDFVTVLSAKYKGVKQCEILGRDKECKEVMRILQKRGKKNIVLTGEAGVGKSSIAEKIAFDVANGNCPEALKDHVVLQLNVNSTVAGTMYRGMAEERFKLLVDYLETHENVILFIDEIHMVIGAGGTAANDENDMSNALKPFLASKKAKVIGATTEEEYERIIAKDSAFQRRFKKVIVKEPKSTQVYPMLKNAIKEHKKFHGVAISKDMVEYAILISACFNNTTNNPDRTNDLIDSSMVIAKEQGKKKVDRECILENFDIDFEKYQKMDEHSKKSTAYHEAGHYLVWRFSPTLKDKKGIAVSIMPAEDYLGVTVYDDLSDEVTIYPNKDYYIASLAVNLAGREAEKMFTSDISSGADSDLEKANKMAYNMICHYALGKDANTYSIYMEDPKYHMMSEKIINEINDQKEELLKEAAEYAKKILKDNKDLLEKLVDALLKKGILDENDLEKLFK